MIRRIYTPADKRLWREGYKAGLEAAAVVADQCAQQEEILFGEARMDDDGWGKTQHEHGKDAFGYCAHRIRRLSVPDGPADEVKP